MEGANEILKQVIPILMVPINDYLRYIVSCMGYVRKMTLKRSELSTASASVVKKVTDNTRQNFEVPMGVDDWLNDVAEVMAKEEKVPSSDDIGCFNLKIRHMVGRNAYHIIQEIDSLMIRHSLINWDSRPIPPGRVDSWKASTSTPSTTEHNDFRSREETFTAALKALGPNHKAHVVALLGMGGVGKTTMMQMLKKVVGGKKMFTFIAEAVIGQKTDPDAIQKAVAEYLGIELKETTRSARAGKLRGWFEKNSDGGQNKFLIILDNVWEFVDLTDIGLSPLPNQGVDFKVLLTSRERQVCTEMGAKSNSIINVKLLTNEEGKSLFLQFVKDADDADLDSSFQKIGNGVVSKCQGLPIAIKTIAYNLKGTSLHVWEDALARLNHHDVYKVVNEVFAMSYNNLKDEETKSTFLLCGLIHEDLAPVEELARYGWGLNLFSKVYTIREARNRIIACIERLMHANLLIKSDDVGYFRIHDLVRAFILDMFSKVEHASIVNNGTMPAGWPDNNDMSSSSCKRISLTCKGMSEFPRDLNFPNLSILKLINGDELLKFPEDFYREMENLQVISYKWMVSPLLPSSPQCSTNLRVLHVHQCINFIDYSSIGSLLNLEVLSLADTFIKELPSTVGNLKKLRLLDLTNCVGVRIEKGVLKKLVKLEELYARIFVTYTYTTFKAAVRFMGAAGAGYGERSYGEQHDSLTDDDWSEIAECSKKLCVLEFQFKQQYSPPNNISCENLERFNITVGFYPEEFVKKNSRSFENKLSLETNRGTVLDSRLNELFVKTAVLCLSVGDINDLSDLEVKFSHSPRSSSFNNVRVLRVSACKELRYLFTLGNIAKALSKLEHLEVRECKKMEKLIRNKSSGEETITFPCLKSIKVVYLPNLASFFLGTNEFQSPLFEFPNLTRVSIRGCHKLEHVFTSSMVGSLLQLQELKISDCQLMEEVIVNDANVAEGPEMNEIVLPCLKSLTLDSLPNLKGFRLGKESFSLPLLDTLSIYKCAAITTFTKGNWATPKLKEIEIGSYSFNVVGEDINSIIKIKQQELEEVTNE